MISFKHMAPSDLDLWEKWTTIPHVKDSWFIEGYETPDYIHQKLKGNGYDYPFIILHDEKPIGYIQCCDLYAYSQLCQEKKGLFTSEPPGTFCIDLFIADVDYLDKGYGTETMRQFVQLVFKTFVAQTIKIDPDTDNKRAIRCYEKAGFEKTQIQGDGVNSCQVMEITTQANTPQEKLAKFIEPIVEWAYQQAGINSIGLVGSYASGTAHDKSDIDLILLCDNKKTYLENTGWITQFGLPTKIQIEEYGKVTSLRVWYQNSFEVEFSFALKDWGAVPMDSGTQTVISNGMCLLVDKQGILKNLLSELPESLRQI